MRPGSRVQRYTRDETADDIFAIKLIGPIGTIVSMSEGEDDEDGGPRFEWAIIAWADGRHETIDNSTATRIWDFEDVTPRVWVNVYLHDRAYGGPEEGGWWFDNWDAIYEESMAYLSEAEAEAAAVLKQVWCDRENSDRNSDINSVCSDGRYEVRQEAYPPVPSPMRRPRYC